MVITLTLPHVLEFIGGVVAGGGLLYLLIALVIVARWK